LPNEADQADAAIKALGDDVRRDAFQGPRGLCTAGLAGYMNQTDLPVRCFGQAEKSELLHRFRSRFGTAGAPSAAFTYLDNAAKAGGATPSPAPASTELTDVFNQIFAQVIKTNTLRSPLPRCASTRSIARKR